MQHIPRFYTEAPLKSNMEIIIGDDNHHHIRHVLRMKEGSAALIFNGQDGEFSATLDSGTRHESRFILHEQTRPQSEDSTPWLVIGILKADIMGWLVEKSCELRVAGILPIITAHTSDPLPRADKLRTRAIKAAQQCERLTVPEIRDPVQLADLPTALPSDHHIYAAIERGDHPPISEALRNLHARPSLLVGPAGGFSEAEADSIAAMQNVTAVSLGASLLRAETAALLGLSLLYINHCNRP